MNDVNIKFMQEDKSTEEKPFELKDGSVLTITYDVSLPPPADINIHQIEIVGSDSQIA